MSDEVTELRLTLQAALEQIDYLHGQLQATTDQLIAAQDEADAIAPHTHDKPAPRPEENR